MPPRIKLYVLLLRALLVLVDIAVLVGFAFSDRVVGLLPRSTGFVVVFVLTGLALIVWMSGITGERGTAEREIYLRAARRFVAWLRPKLRLG